MSSFRLLMQDKDWANVFERVFEVSQSLLAVVGTDGHFVRLNQAWERILGHSRDELIAAPFIDFVHPDDVERTLAAYAATERAGVFENRYRHRDGSYRWLCWEEGIDFGEELIVVTARDVTEQRQATLALEESQQLNRALLDAIPDLMFRVSLDGVYLDCHAPHEGLLAVPREQIVGMTIWDTPLPPAVQRACMDALARAIERGRLEVIEYFLELPVGTRSFEARIVPSGSQEAVLIVRDVSEQKSFERKLIDAREEALSAARAKSAFLANMSHEIRTPMNAILGMNGLLGRTELTQEQREYVEIVDRSGEGLLNIIDDILSLSKIEAGQLTLELIPFDLPQMLRDCLRLFEAEARERNLDLSLQLGEGVPQMVRGDPTRLRQTLLNLIGNALKFTPEGSITLGVTTGEAQGTTFSVRDTGIGMSEEQASVIFKAFQQADGSTTRKFGGTGLGLAISQSLVDIMGGVLEVESSLGSGSCFHFTIPLPVFSGVASLAPRSDERRPLEARVLVVEDNAVNRKLALKLLQGLGCDAVAAENGARALEILQNEPFDVILMDCQMPELDGYEATRLLREREDEGQHVPVVALTAHAMDGDKKRCLDAGMDDYLTKPVRPNALAKVLERWVRAPAKKGVVSIDR